MSAAVLRPTFGKPPVTTDEYFGGCPVCGKSDGFVDVGADHHFCCDEHRTRWYVGSNLFSSWRQPKSPEQVAFTARVMTYREVEPVCTGCAAPAQDIPYSTIEDFDALLADMAKDQEVVAHPDADLLALCARLAAMQEEWQRLWQPTSEDWGFDDPPITEADRNWLAYNDNVWPGIGISRWSLKDPLHPDDLGGRLLDLHATTQEGVRAKAAAILAMEDAACYGANVRNDACELLSSILVDVVGPARCLMGEDRK